MRRPKLSPRRESEVYAFYGRQCVVCDQNAPTIHHLDEVNTNDAFENLIPLCSNANSGLEWNRGSPKRYRLYREILPTTIAGAGTSHFIRGDYRRAYACNRLCAYVQQTRYGDLSGAAEALAFCLSSLQSVGASSLIHGTLMHFHRLCAEATLEPFWKGEFLNQCSIILYGDSRLDAAGKFESVRTGGSP